VLFDQNFELHDGRLNLWGRGKIYKTILYPCCLRNIWGRGKIYKTILYPCCLRGKDRDNLSEPVSLEFFSRTRTKR